MKTTGKGCSDSEKRLRGMQKVDALLRMLFAPENLIFAERSSVTV